MVRAPAPMHGKVSAIRHDGSDLFAGLPSPFNATRYHSLIVAPRHAAGRRWSPPRGPTDGIIMGLRHRTLPICGVQFHPESIASEHGHDLLANFLRIARGAGASSAPARAA